MNNSETISIITFSLGLLGTLFTIYNHFKKPQISLDKRQAIDEEKRQSKDNLLEEKMKWEREANDKKFCDLSKSIEDAFLLASNHTHTVDTKVDALGKEVSMNTKELVRLGTIIEERIPKK